MKIFRAFTLAEVLITLGIIGVVAAMTMPTLINQTNGAQYKAAFKKSLSAISQAATLSVAQDDISFADTIASSGGELDPPEGGPSIASILNSKMNIVNAIGDVTPYGINPTYPTGSGVTSIPIADTWIFFNDGSMFALPSSLPAGYGCSKGERICIGYVDVNGLKGPNKPVVCDTAANTKTDTITDGEIVIDNTACTVKTPTDIYPVYFYDQTIVPATNAGRAVLYGK